MKRHYSYLDRRNWLISEIHLVAFGGYVEEVGKDWIRKLNQAFLPQGLSLLPYFFYRRLC